MCCAGNTCIHTPNLDELAASGQRFTHAFTPSPVCVAARMSLITGQRMRQTPFVGNGCLSPAEPVLPTLCTPYTTQAYRTQAVGKMHFRGNRYGFHGIKSQEECPDSLIDGDYLLFLQEHSIRHGSRMVTGIYSIFSHRQQPYPSPSHQRLGLLISRCSF